MDPSGLSPHRVLLVTAGVGAGHSAVASAIEDGIRHRWPQVCVRTVDVLTLEPVLFGRLMRHGNIVGMTRTPRLYGALYRTSDRHKSRKFAVSERIRNFVLALVLRHLRVLVDQFRPQVVVHSHWCSVPALVGGDLPEELQGRQAVVVTDLIAHRYWFAPSVARWFVAAPETSEKLLAWGISPESISVSGIPVRRVWDEPPSADEVLKNWSLPAGRPVVVLTGGATFTVGSIPSLARRIRAACGEATLVVLCGTNRGLRSRIEKLAAGTAGLIAVPFTNRVHELVSAATVFVTKSGGITTAECLAAGIPVVLLPPVPGQEAENAEWLERHGAAVVARDEAAVVREVRRLLDDEPARLALARSARALHRPGREAVLAYIRDSLGLD